MKAVCRSGHPISINFNEKQTSKSRSVALSISGRKLHLTPPLLFPILHFKSEICKYFTNPVDARVGRVLCHCSPLRVLGWWLQKYL